jgi:hypothetical protein
MEATRRLEILQKIAIHLMNDLHPVGKGPAATKPAWKHTPPLWRGGGISSSMAVVALACHDAPRMGWALFAALLKANSRVKTLFERVYL